MLPWREWYQHNVELGALEADQASAVAVLHNLHESFDITLQPIEIMCLNKEAFVVAKTDCPPNLICLPPCVPKQCKVFCQSEHPAAVNVSVQVMNKVAPAPHKFF